MPKLNREATSFVGPNGIAIPLIYGLHNKLYTVCLPFDICSSKLMRLMWNRKQCDLNVNEQALYLDLSDLHDPS